MSWAISKADELLLMDAKKRQLKDGEEVLKEVRKENEWSTWIEESCLRELCWDVDKYVEVASRRIRKWSDRDGMKTKAFRNLKSLKNEIDVAFVLIERGK